VAEDLHGDASRDALLEEQGGRGVPGVVQVRRTPADFTDRVRREFVPGSARLALPAFVNAVQ
jgi:hypothetical protein